MTDKQHDLFFPHSLGAVYLSPDTGALITHLATRRESLKKKNGQEDLCKESFVGVYSGSTLHKSSITRAQTKSDIAPLFGQ